MAYSKCRMLHPRQLNRRDWSSICIYLVSFGTHLQSQSEGIDWAHNQWLTKFEIRVQRPTAAKLSCEAPKVCYNTHSQHNTPCVDLPFLYSSVDHSSVECEKGKFYTPNGSPEKYDDGELFPQKDRLLRFKSWSWSLDAINHIDQNIHPRDCIYVKTTGSCQRGLHFSKQQIKTSTMTYLVDTLSSKSLSIDMGYG